MIDFNVDYSKISQQTYKVVSSVVCSFFKTTQKVVKAFMETKELLSLMFKFPQLTSPIPSIELKK